MTQTQTEPKRRTLLDISADLVAIDELLFESGGDISDPAVAEAIDAWFAEIERDETTKVGNYIGLIQEKTLRESAIKAEVERLTLLAKALGNSAKGLKDRLKFYMELVGKKKIETARGNATVCGNGGKTPLWIDDQITIVDVPLEYRKITITMDGPTYSKLSDLLRDGNVSVEVEINHNKVREALEAGEELTREVELTDSDGPRGTQRVQWARLEDRGTHLRIK